MSRYIATTETGAVYTLDLDANSWSYRGSSSDIDNEVIVSFKLGDDENSGITWGKLNSWPDAGKPELGKRMYLNGLDAWRVSTNVIDIQEVSE